MSYALISAGLSKELYYMINNTMINDVCLEHVAKLAPVVNELKGHIESWKQRNIEFETFAMYLNCGHGTLLSGECLGMYFTDTQATLKFCGWWGTIYENTDHLNDGKYIPYILSTDYELMENVKNSCAHNWILEECNREIIQTYPSNTCYQIGHNVYCDLDNVRMEMKMMQVMYPRCQWRDKYKIQN